MLLLAMDKAPSVRSFDTFGRLNVAVSNLTKQNVRDYVGREVPGWKAAGLDSDKIYRFFCPIEELEKALPTFNNLPVLSEHVPVTAWSEESHASELVVGSTGTDAAIDGQFLTNSMVIWAKASIDGIVNDEKRELSAAYLFTPVMTPGNFAGVDYDGVMVDIIGNHEALVFAGRAGSDVIVGDEQPMSFKSKRALMLAGGLGGLIRPLLAQDAKLDLGKALDGVSNKSMSKSGASRALGTKIYGLVQPHLAQDAELDVEGICKVIDAVQGTPLAEDDEIQGLPVVGDEDDEDKDKKPKVAEDEDPDDDDDKKPAMDEATVNRKIAEAVAQGRKNAQADFNAIRTAEREVFPVTGELVAMDSAVEVYKAGLENLGVDISSLPVSAYGATFRAVSGQKTASLDLAQDSARSVSANSRSDFNSRFPNRPKLVRG